MPHWIKQLYKDSGTKGLTAFLLLGSIIFDVCAHFVNGSSNMIAVKLCYSFYFIIFLPVAYLNRDTK